MTSTYDEFLSKGGDVYWMVEQQLDDGRYHDPFDAVVAGDTLFDLIVGELKAKITPAIYDESGDPLTSFRETFLDTYYDLYEVVYHRQHVNYDDDEF
jgi:hypothetical protein